MAQQIIDPDQISQIVLPKIRFNEIQLGNQIGHGCFGQVFKGKCRGMEVAIKLLDDIEWSNEVEEEFIKEVDIMARVRHPNLLMCLGACLDIGFKQNYAIVMEFMPKGDLYSILHDSQIELTLPKQLQFGIDIAKGMAWLRSLKILHRDLKPANILVDNNWTCKVGDFGLSQIHRSRQKKRDEDDAPGSVLWMAPEVLLKEEFDFMIDVYAFALVFWEILTRNNLFTEFQDREVFTDQIARKNVRPPLDGIHSIIQRILCQAWNRYPNQRPTFQTLVGDIQKAVIEIYLPKDICPDSGKFWETNFPGQVYVGWRNFVKSLQEELGRELTSTQELALEKLVGEEVHKEKQISIEQWSLLLKWFGKMKSQGQLDVVERMEYTMKQPWFFGKVSMEEANQKLRDCQPGTFLVRLNMRGVNPPIERTPFTISRRPTTFTSDEPFVHTRVYTLDTQMGFFITIQSERIILGENSQPISIVTYIENLMKQRPDICKSICQGWPWASIFSTPLSPPDVLSPKRSPYQEDGIVSAMMNKKQH